jgi:two-component system, NarL family, sensor histidine kinase UhpB
MFHLTKASASLRTRLILIPPVFLLLGIIVAIAVTLVDAPKRIAAETTSGRAIAGHLIQNAIDNFKSTGGLDATMERLTMELSHVRHVRVEYRSVTGTPVARLITPKSAREAPAWFDSWLASPGDAKAFPLHSADVPGGEFVLLSEPADEVDEIWQELIFLISLLSTASLGVVLLIWLSTNIALKPLRDLVEGLNRLEKGQFEALGEIRVVELQRVGEQINRLAQSLARTEADNRLLIGRLISIQESERKQLARELHDEFGASLFGIRAAASCIVEAAAANGQERHRLAEIVERASLISDLADTIQKHNYRILERIQPIVLDQMGLYNALQHLVDVWSVDHRSFNCELQMPAARPAVGDEVGLTVYRIVQECLTNIARHSHAAHAQITIGSDADQSIALCIADDGVGLPQNFRFGFGLLGMTERVRKIGGRLRVSNGVDRGTLVEIFIPGDSLRSSETEEEDPQTIESILQAEM